jgi:hypothetical protein
MGIANNFLVSQEIGRVQQSWINIEEAPRIITWRPCALAGEIKKL